MARVEIPFAVTQTSNGAAVAGASVQVNVRGGGPATVYAAETGGTTLSNPLTTDAAGRIEGWLDEGSYNLVVSGGTITTYTQAIDLTRGDGVSRYAAASITSTALAAPVLQALLPTGAVIPYAALAAPAGYLVCDGSAVSRTTYAALFTLLGTTFGTGDGSTTFNLPDYRGRVLVGIGTNAEIDALTDNDGLAVASRKPKHQHGLGTLAVSSAVTGVSIVSGGSHSHSITDPGHQHNQKFSGSTSNPDGQVQMNATLANFGYTLTESATTGITIQSAGSHSHTVTDTGHAHAVTGAVGDTAGPTNGAAYHAIQFIIKT